MGAIYQFQMCNTNKCEDIYSDPREEQCHALDSRYELHGNKHHWLPYEHPDGEYTPVDRKVDEVIWSIDGHKKRLSEKRYQP